MPSAISQQRVGLDLEEVVARVVLEDREQILEVVAREREAGAGHHLGDLAPQHRHVGRARGVRRRRVQPEEPVLADHVARGVVALHADVVEVRRAVHRRARVGLGEHEQRALACLGADRRGQAREARRRLARSGRGRGAAEDAEAADRHRAERVVAVGVGHEVVAAVAEEREVVVGHPAQQRPAFGQLGRVDRRRLRVELGDHRLERAAHGLPVVGRRRARRAARVRSSSRTASSTSVEVSRSTST